MAGASAFRALPNFGGRLGEASLPRAHVSSKYGLNPVPFGTDTYFEGHPFLTKNAVEFLVEEGAAFVGIDTYNIDDTNDGTRPAHTTLLGNNIPICEHMCGLKKLPDHGFRFHAAPVKVKAFGTFPVRAYAVLDK